MKKYHKKHQLDGVSLALVLYCDLAANESQEAQTSIDRTVVPK